jgi:hypothetical protein
MAAATLNAVQQAQPGASVLTAWPQPTTQGIASTFDLIHIANYGLETLVVVNYQGTVLRNTGTTPPASSAGYLVGKFLTRLTSAATTAQIFADVWSQNNTNDDILQVVNVGGNISYWLDFLGVAHGS